MGVKQKQAAPNLRAPGGKSRSGTVKSPSPTHWIFCGFSKTSIIKWHQVEKKKFGFSAVLWLVSLALYKVDYRLGFAAVSVLSLLHVVLEFPLNFVSIRSIFSAVIPKPRPA
jgi:hypothetical protein